METPLLPIITGVGFFSLVMLYLVILRSGAQSVIADRDTRRSDGSDKYKGVGQQYIIKY